MQTRCKRRSDRHEQRLKDSKTQRLDATDATDTRQTRDMAAVHFKKRQGLVANETATRAKRELDPDLQGQDKGGLQALGRLGK